MYALGCLLFWLLRADAVRGRRPARRRAAARPRDGAAARLVRPGAPRRGAALVDALLASDPADRPTAVEVLELLGAAPRRRSGRRSADTVEAAERSTAVFAEPLATAVLEPPRVTPARKRRRSRRMALVVAGIAAAGALAFVGATIANADRVVEVPG